MDNYFNYLKAQPLRSVLTCMYNDGLTSMGQLDCTIYNHEEPDVGSNTFSLDNNLSGLV